MSAKLFEDLLRIVIRTFYTEVAVVAIEHILHYSKLEEHDSNEEHKMSVDLNLPHKIIRSNLLELEKHQILLYKEGKKDNRGEERTGNMFTRGPDQKKMVYWSFDQDLKNVIFGRIIALRKALDDLVEEASKVSFFCPNCQKNYTIEEALPDFLCNICPKSTLQRKETDVEEAKKKRQDGIQLIKHMESRMKECLDVSLPSSFFGVVGENNRTPAERNASIRLAKPTTGAGGFIVTVNLPEQEVEVKETLVTEHDAELIKYYQKLERRNKKKEVVQGLRFSVQGNLVDLGEITQNMQVLMTREEFSEFYNARVQRYDYI